METGGVFKETTPPARPPAPSEQATDWEKLKDALTWSMGSGSFLDSQFYALDSKPRAGTPTIRQIYFCSTVFSGILPRLVKCRFSIPGRWEALLKLALDSSRIWPSSKIQCVNDYDSDLDDEVSGVGIPT